MSAHAVHALAALYVRSTYAMLARSLRFAEFAIGAPRGVSKAFSVP
ncbi:MAG TPA: hypothetical protein PLI17_16965 [Denitromonas sp.]|nr:hypothetical protein [Denitromonas sp.]